MPAVKLPVSMEDEELFPKHKYGISDRGRFDAAIFSQMYRGLDKVWWSRLVTSVRGYIVNDFKENDNLLFCFDDVFIYLHRSLVEETEKEAMRVVSDMETLEDEGTQGLQKLLEGVVLAPEKNPFHRQKTADAFKRLFGTACSATYQKAFKQGFAYVVFLNVFYKLQKRWLIQSQKKKGVSFQEDSEWQPTSRVVIFQELFPGNRTWVLTDYDRHVIFFWRPHGVKVIFGDRYVQTKMREGFKLCAYCGLIEQMLDQFPPCKHCYTQQKKSPAFYCSKSCQEMNWPKHKIEHSAV